MKGFAVFLSYCIQVSGQYIITDHTHERTRINVLPDAKPGLWLVVSTN